jgi:altronate dehydratase
MKNNDMVATALENFEAGETADIYSKENEYIESCKCLNTIPFGNKIALLDIKKGDKVVKYGAVIGECTRDIRRGQLVHVHNVKSLAVDIPEAFKIEIMRQMDIKPEEDVKL